MPCDPRLLVRFETTLLFDVPDLSRRAQRLLYAANHRNRFTVRNGQLVEMFSAKGVCSEEPLRDASLAGQAIQTSLSLTSQQPPFLDEALADEIAEEFQPKLLFYRLTNYGKVGSPEIDVSELSAPLQDVARAFASCVTGDEELQREVVELLRERDRQVRHELSTGLESAVLEALLFCCHQANRSHALAGELADIINRLWTERCEGRQTNPESVGWKLRALGLGTVRIGNRGNGLQYTEALRERVHALARSYGVLSPQLAVKRACRHCNPAVSSATKQR